ncbi:pentatricopeptide repeat-containing protein At3g24000, mitochondrial-like [Chenopodium quinoa]|uniref:DYW domain-containing protein n=1 Tax=Chenopodium quinoa TaxID=63459 RepID=A0A803KQR7_CHEQI|nr:pentatricopeptide repeat-containing protein At3g24000, mitochondrial-like [Chenopodium quinoa]
MRRCAPFCLRKLSYNDLRGFVPVKECHEHFWGSFGAQAVRLSTEFNVLGCEEGRHVDVFQRTHHRDLLKSSDVKTSQQARKLVERGCLQPDPLFYNRLLKKCVELGDLREGRIIHALVLTSEFKDDIFILNNIINMYVKCGSLGEARICFDEMPAKDTFTWTTMIVAYTQNGRPEAGLSMIPKMLHLGLKPNNFTFSILLKASGAISSAKHGMHIHTLCIKYGCDSNVYVGTSLVDMYARCGLIDEAQSIFDGLVSKNEVSWNALIAGHARKDRGEEALKLFQSMKREDFDPSDFTYSTVLNACASAGILEQGKWIHAHVIKCGVKLTDFVGHTLLHMYAKCGSIEDAEKVFARLVERDVVSWNSILTGYAQHGLGHKSLEQFDIMLKTGMQPNAITFLCLLTSCSHAGFVEQGQYYFEMMKTYGLEPKIEHYVTIVDLLGRAGKLDQALKFIRDMPVKPVAEIWKCLLGACRMHRNMELGVYAAEQTFDLDPYDSGPYVILANMYALAGRRNDVAKVRKMMKDSRVRKEPACSWVEIENAVHVFVADDDTHPQSKEIYDMWESISAKIKEIGYVPDTSHVLLFLEDHEREAKLQHHSEKLALAFACLNTPPKSTIRIKKNIRVCGDCHLAFKFASTVIERDIIVRDTNRFHHFRNGSCSCGDYW